MEVTIRKLLEFFEKVSNLGISYGLERVGDKGYRVNLLYDWYNTGTSSMESVFIDFSGLDVVENDSVAFSAMRKILDAKVSEKEAINHIKRRRQKSLSELSDEEKEFLGFEL